MSALTTSIALITAMTLHACSDAPEPARAPPDPVAPRCADPTQAPVDDARARHGCITVGASEAAAMGEFVDPASLGGTAPMPVRYVRAGARAGGDGTPERPFATIAEALTARASGTLVLSRGTHLVDASARFDGAFAVLGAGVTVTTVRVAFGRAAFVASGAGRDGTLRGLSIDAVETSSPGTDAAVEARDGATLRVRDLRVVGARAGARASGLDATLDIDGITILRAASVGVISIDGARARVHRALLRDGQNYGTFAGTSMGREAEPIAGRLHLSDSLIAGHGSYGVVYAGIARPGAGSAACVDDPLGPRGELDCVQRVAVQGSTVTGVNLAGARSLKARLMVVTDTRANPAGQFGDGLFVGAGTRLSLDLDLVGDASREEGSWLVGNARAGILVDGADAHLRVHGAMVGSNRGPGVFVQRGAAGDEVDYSTFAGNVGVGLGVAPTATLASIQCDIFISTHRATFTSPSGERYELGDGLSAFGLTGARVVGNVVSHNERFGVVLLNAGGPGDRRVVLRNNRGVDNQYGLGAYNSTGVDIDAPGAIAGRLSPPTSAPRLADAQNVM